jgi:hypothetical protein
LLLAISWLVLDYSISYSTHPIATAGHNCGLAIETIDFANS